MLRPAPFPGEYALGFEGRFARLNGFTSQRQADGALLVASERGSLSFNFLSRAEALACVAGQSVETFVQLQTTIPLRRFAVAGDGAMLPHGSRLLQNVLQKSALTHIDPRKYFCMECVKEDHAFHGMSYWRREHQISGLPHCPKHKTFKVFTRDRNAFSHPPSTYVDGALEIEDALRGVCNSNPVVARFQQLAIELLDRQLPVRIGDLHNHLADLALNMGVHVGQGRVLYGMLLSDWLIHNLPLHWLEQLAPGVRSKQTGKLFVPIDGVLAWPAMGAAISVYVLTLAAFHDSVDQALNALKAMDERDAGKQLKAHVVSPLGATSTPEL